MFATLCLFSDLYSSFIHIRSFLTPVAHDKKPVAHDFLIVAHGSCPAARCEAPAVAQGYPFPTLFPFRSGQSHSFRALSIWHGSLLGKFRPRLGGVGPRLTARALRLGARPRPWLKAGFFLPFAHLVPADHILFGPLIYPTSHGSGVLTPARGEAPATTSLCFQKLQFIWPSTKL